MCGATPSSVSKSTLRERFQVETPERCEERYNVAPSQRVLAVREREDGARSAGMLRWGLVPRWAKDAKVGFMMLNARAETLLEKPAYRGLVKRHRCLVVADGFYEWQVGADGKKQPVRFALAGGEPFAFAGLWTRWRDSERGEQLVSCTIVTTRPNELVAPVHDRMPVILQPPHRCRPASRRCRGCPSRVVPAMTALNPAAMDEEALEALAQRVAHLVANRVAAGPPLVNAETVARHLNVERSFIYENAAKLGALRLGDGPRARLRFDLAEVERRLTC